MSEKRPSFQLLLFILSAAYILLILSLFRYPTTFWGVNHLSYFGWDTRIIVIVASLILPILLFRSLRLKIPQALRVIVLYLVFPAILAAIFYKLKVATHFLGDGILRAEELEIGVTHLPTEPLGVFLNYLAYRITSGLFSFSSVRAIEALSIVSGIACYYAVLFFARSVSRRTEERLLFSLLLLFSGTTLLFCGYVESYLFIPAALIFFLASGVRAITTKSSLLVPCAAYLILVMLHFSNICFAPAMAALAYFYYKQENRRAIAVVTTTLALSILAVILIPLVSPLRELGVHQPLIPLLPAEADYWLFSGQHLLDILNQLLLTATAAIVLILATLIVRPTLKLFDAAEKWFVLAALPGALAFISLLDPKLGYASDWDLFSSSGVVLTAAAIILTARAGWNKVALSAKIMLSAVAILSFVSFAVINLDYERSIERQVDILSLYGERGAIGFETMGNYFAEVDDDQRAEQMWKRSGWLRPHRRIYSNLGQLMINQNRLDEAEKMLKKGLSLDSTYAVMVMNLGVVYSRTGRAREGETLLRKAAKLRPDDPGFKHNLALNLIDQRRYSEAEEFSRMALQSEPNNISFINGLATSLSRQEKYDEAETLLFRVIQFAPSIAVTYLNLARLNSMRGRQEQAISYLELYLSRYPNSGSSGRVRQMLSELKGIH